MRELNLFENIYHRTLAPAVFRGYNLMKYGDTEVFKGICIETDSSCNRKCRCCPVAYYPREKIKMPESIFHRIIYQLAAKKYCGEIGLHWYNEPIMDERLPEFIKHAHDRCRKSYIYFASNGDFLDMEKLDIMVNSGLSRINITRYDGKLGPNLEKLFRDMDEARRRHIHIFVNRWDFLDEKSPYLRNRAGILNNLKIGQPVRRRCTRPDLQMIINAEGKVVLCCNDYFGKEIMGDVTTENIFDIWKKEKFRKIRNELKKGNRKNLSLCGACDFPFEGYFLPRRLVS